MIEEQIILPALQEGDANEQALAEVEIRGDLAKMLRADLRSIRAGPRAAAKFAVLASEIEQLIEIEERPSSRVLALAESREDAGYLSRSRSDGKSHSAARSS